MALFKNKQRERIIALDLLRGTFLLVIFINHLAWSPSLFSFFTGSSHLLASAAEGFFVISGILIGYIYGPRILKSTKPTIFKLLKRAGWLYILSIGFTLLYSLIAIPLEPDYMRTNLVFEDQFVSVADYLYQIITLQFIFGWADFLARYAVFMVFAPFALWLIAKKYTWLVVTLSAIIWLTLSHSAVNMFASWVIIFFPSIAIGYYLPQIEAWFKSKFKGQKRQTAYGALFLITLVTYVLSILAVTVFPFLYETRAAMFPEHFQAIMKFFIDTNTSLQSGLFNRDTMGIGRLVIGVVWFWALYIVYRKYEHEINNRTRGFLLLFGTNSLYVYGWSSVLIIATDILLPPVEWRSILLNTMVVSNLVIILYVITRKRRLGKDLRTRIFQPKKDIS